jgi:hypothetical protein
LMLPCLFTCEDNDTLSASPNKIGMWRMHPIQV